MPLYHTSGSVLGFCGCLASGATLSLGRKFATKSFWTEVHSTNATAIQYVGETCRYLLSAPPSPLDKDHSVRLAFGNGLRPDIWNRFKERFGIEAIAEFYSATEGASGTWNYSKNDFSRGAVGRVGSFGHFMTNSGTAIVDMDFETELPYRDPSTGLCKRVVEGYPGELLYKLDPEDVSIRFQGYYKNPDSTESKILRNVLKKGDAYFRTGDIMSFDSEGRTYFNDRIGDTFRWKSENVSTSEVSECLGLHPKVKEANVYGVEIPHHDGRAGCVAVVLDGNVDEGLMRDLAVHTGRLPGFARPAFIRVVKGEMIVNGTNKQLKHIVRKEGVDPGRVGEDELWWLKGGNYVRFEMKDWDALNRGMVKL
jgi:acyl-CoA synthetase (AMP-forming)/AMP-acid ligase II